MVFREIRSQDTSLSLLAGYLKMKISYMTVLNGNITTMTVSKWGTDDWPLCWAKINYQNGMQWFRSSLDRRCACSMCVYM